MEWKATLSTVYSYFILLEVTSLASVGGTVSAPPTTQQTLATTYSSSFNRGDPGMERHFLSGITKTHTIVSLD